MNGGGEGVNATHPHRIFHIGRRPAVCKPGVPTLVTVCSSYSVFIIGLHVQVVELYAYVRRIVEGIQHSFHRMQLTILRPHVGDWQQFNSEREMW
jgi:hypothetical protein